MYWTIEFHFDSCVVFKHYRLIRLSAVMVKVNGEWRVWEGLIKEV